MTDDKALAKLPTPRNEGADLVLTHGEKILRGLASTVDRDQFMHALMVAANESDLGKCEGMSILAAAYGACRLGLTPGKIEGLCHFVPFKGVCTLVVGYPGYLTLAQRNNYLKAIHCEVVYEGERFRYWVDETGPRLEHEPNLDRDVYKDRPVAAYCLSQLTTGGHQIRVISPKELDKVDSGKRAWKSEPHEMRLKTAIRRAAKHWRKTPELAQALQWEEQTERGERQQIDLADIVDGPTAPPANPNQIGSLLGDDEQPGPDDTSQYSDDPAGDSGPVTDDDIDSMMDK